MGAFGGTEVLIIVAIIVLFFGAKKIPELARGIGEGMTEFKKATNNNDELEDNNNEKSTQSDSAEPKKTHSE